MATSSRSSFRFSSAVSGREARGVLLAQPLPEQGAEAGAGAVRPVVEIGVEILAGPEVLGDVAGPGVERLLHLLPLPSGGAGGGPGHDRQLGGAALGVEGVGDAEGGVAEERLQPLRLGDQRGPRGRAQNAQPLLPGEPLRAGGRRAEARAPGVRPFEERPARLGQPPRQRRVALPRVGDPDGARRHHRAVGQETQAQLLADWSLEAGGENDEEEEDGAPVGASSWRGIIGIHASDEIETPGAKLAAALTKLPWSLEVEASHQASHVRLNRERTARAWRVPPAWNDGSLGHPSQACAVPRSSRQALELAEKATSFAAPRRSKGRERSGLERHGTAQACRSRIKVRTKRREPERRGGILRRNAASSR